MRPGSSAGPTRPMSAAEQAQLRSQQISEREREITDKIQRELLARGSASFREAAMSMNSQPNTVAAPAKKVAPSGLPKAPAPKVSATKAKAPEPSDEDEEDEDEDYEAEDFDDEEQEAEEEEAEEEEDEEQEEEEDEEEEEEEEEEDAPRKKFVTVKLVRSGDAAMKMYDINTIGINSKTFKDLIRKISSKCGTDPKTTVLKSLDGEGDLLELDDAGSLKHLLKVHAKTSATGGGALRIYVGDAKNPVVNPMGNTITSSNAGNATITVGGATVTAKAVNHFASATSAADTQHQQQLLGSTQSSGTIRGMSGFFEGTIGGGSSATSGNTIVMPTPGQTLQWTKMKLLGKGSFGTVNEGITNDGKLMAVKMVELAKEKVNDENDSDLVALRSEITLMTQLKHQNIVAYYGCQTIELEGGSQQFEIFMEHCHGGSLTSLRKKFSPKDGKLKIGLARHYTRQILQGLKYLHEHQVIHRDIKSDNVLISASGEAKLADFGCSKHLSTATVEAGAQTVVGSPLFMAPEVLTGTDEGYTFSADVWSVGCLLLELLGRKPWALSGNNAYQLMYQISQSKTMPTGVPEHCPPKLKDFFARVFDRDASKRASCKELLEHPWMTCPDAELEDVEAPTDAARSDIK